MPKILESVREQLLITARRQIEENGYAKTTIRSVAAECGIAVGTVYNYFPSKDMLIASYIAEDWTAFLEQIQTDLSKDAETHLRHIYDALHGFMNKHRTLFSDTDAAAVYTGIFPFRHRQLRKQLAGMIAQVCPEETDAESPSLPEFISEAFLTWTIEGVSFERIYQLLEKLLKRQSEL